MTKANRVVASDRCWQDWANSEILHGLATYRLFRHSSQQWFNWCHYFCSILICENEKFFKTYRHCFPIIASFVLFFDCAICITGLIQEFFPFTELRMNWGDLSDVFADRPQRRSVPSILSQCEEFGDHRNLLRSKRAYIKNQHEIFSKCAGLRRCWKQAKSYGYHQWNAALLLYYILLAFPSNWTIGSC